jgi:hypothetical protein
VCFFVFLPGVFVPQGVYGGRQLQAAELRVAAGNGMVVLGGKIKIVTSLVVI